MYCIMLNAIAYVAIAGTVIILKFLLGYEKKNAFFINHNVFADSWTLSAFRLYSSSNSAATTYSAYCSLLRGRVGHWLTV